MFKTNKVLSLSVVAAGLMSAGAFADINANLEIKDSGRLMNTSDVVATVSFTNTDAKPARMLSYLMKANQNGELEEHIFNVKRDGMEVKYTGMHVKRPAPTAADYTMIKPGQTVSYDVELSSSYGLQEAGEYTFQYNAHNVNLFAVNEMTDFKAAKMGIDGITSNTASAFIAKDASYDLSRVVQKAKPCNPKKEDCSGTPHPSGILFTGACSSGEQTDLVSALAASQNMVNDSIASLNGASGDRYTTWFGAYDSGRHNTVSGNFDAIKDAMDNQQLTFDCSCNQSYFAYVYPDQPYKVYFCGAFWNANETGTDSRGGTIIHEISHFTAVAGTDDIVYGQSGAQSLAISNPNDAIINADSHEYFGENTPNQN
jgi:peptidyl-Lys metalloendopeptidase